MLTSAGHSLSVYFKSDSSLSRSGFNATYMIAKCGGNMSATFTPQYFTSPNYPSLYTNNADCVWTIKPSIPAFLVELIVMELRTESCCDYVEVHDSSRMLGRLKGNARNRVFMSQSGELKIRFHSDQSVAFAGFRAPSLVYTCGTNHTATTTPTPLTSPHYPDNYPNNLECEWNLVARGSFQVELNVVELLLSAANYVDIFDGVMKLARLKGNITARSYISTSGGLRVVFHSDGSVTMRGFNATFVQGEIIIIKLKPTSCQTNLVATTETQYFSSTNYPDNYPNNEDCSWTITTDPSQQIELNIIEMEIEQCCDHLEVFDGDSLVAELAGSATNQQFTSSSGVLLIRFTDGTEVRGFNATIYEVTPQPI
ncbi:CUB domain-containing protein 2-like [Ciona intestinalis]